MPLRNVDEPTIIKSSGAVVPGQPDGFNKTGTHLSTNIIIFATSATGVPIPVGAVKTLQITEQRNIARISEVGTDGVIDSAPNQSTQINGSCTRTRFNGRRIAEAFGRGFLHIKSQRTPFNIEIHDIFRGDTDAAVITTIENVWFSNLQYSYNSENFVIEDQIQFQAEDIHSRLGNTQNTAVLNQSLAINPFETSSDIGDHRGALDGVGLLAAFDTGSL